MLRVCEMPHVGDGLIGMLKLVDASKLARTCRRLRGIHFSMIVTGKTLLEEAGTGHRFLCPERPIACQYLAVDERSVDAGWVCQCHQL